jgi:hypothetical protein
MRPSTPRSSKRLPSFAFPHQTALRISLDFQWCHMPPPHLVLELLFLIMCGEEYTKTNFSLYSFKADSHYTSRFRSVAKRHRSVKFSHGYLNGYVHTDSNVSVKSQFRSVAVAVAERECLTGRHGSDATSPARFFFGNG